MGVLIQHWKLLNKNGKELLSIETVMSIKITLELINFSNEIKCLFISFSLSFFIFRFLIINLLFLQHCIQRNERI